MKQDFSDIIKKLNTSGKEKALSYLEGLNDGLRAGRK